MAEMLALMADSRPPAATHGFSPVRATDEWLWDSATDFCAALELYAGRAKHVKRAAH